MATIDLGKIAFVNKGTYNNSTTYEKNDLVQFTDGGILSTYLYIDSTAQSGQAPSSSGTAGSRWVYFAKGGTAGTDVGTTITTQGDILYRDGSGLQRLGAGTSGQVLQTGGAGANPSWGTLSSDFVKVYATSTDTSNSAYHDYVHFSDAYQHYRVIYTDDGTVSGTSHFLRVGNGSIDTGANYRWQAHYTANAATGSHGSTGDSQMRVGWSGNGSGYNNTNIVDFLNVRDSSQATTMFSRRWCMDHASTWLNVTMAGRHEINGVIDRFRIFNDGGGNLIIKNIAIYGMKI